MTDVVPIGIKPKEERDLYNGHDYLLRFDPNAPQGAQWVWQVNFKVTYVNFGSEPTLPKARNAARRRIRRLQGDNERWQE